MPDQDKADGGVIPVPVVITVLVVTDLWANSGLIKMKQKTGNIVSRWGGGGI